VSVSILSLMLAMDCFAALLSDPAVDAYNVRVGTQTFAGLYQFTTNTLLLETAQVIRDMGSDVIKLYLGPNYPRQYRYNLASGITNLLTLVRDDPSCRAVFDLPFRHVIAWAYPFGNGDAPFTDGNYTAAEQANDYRELYDLGRYLLTNYNNSGKTFYLGHWEGDGYLSVNNWSTNPSPAVLQGMIAWENIRQKAIDDAKADASFTNVQVYYYAEANRVRDAMLNGPTNNQRVINRVVPYVTNLDFVSYSSYDAMDLDAPSLYATLDYMKSKLPTNKANAGLGQRLWIGEYGWGGWSTADQEPASRAYIQRLLRWNPRFILFWEIYNNEPNRNFCLVDPVNARAPCYYLHQRFINLARLKVAAFKENQSRVPTETEFADLLTPLLAQPLRAPAALTVSNLAPAWSGDSLLLSGRLAQGVYGDDQAAVWVYWGRRDGGIVRDSWEASRRIGVNTNFNPSTFSTTLSGLQAQTNYYFRFYATNASGEAWAPAADFFSTQTINPDDYGAHLKITVNGSGRPQTLSDYPLLIALSSSVPGFSYRHFAAPGGGDLRFTDAGGTRVLPHEIDQWNTNSTSWVWVRVPQLTGSNECVWAHWGNPLVTQALPSSTNGSVWFPSYAAVWHLRETRLPYEDSARQHPLTSGLAPVTAAGKIGAAARFDGATQYLQAPSLSLGDAFTLSAWVKLAPTATGIQTVAATKPGGWNTDGLALYVNSYLTTDYRLVFETGNGTNGLSAATPSNLVTPGVWHHVAAVVDRTVASARLYIDGVDQTQSSSLQPDFRDGADLVLGRFADGSFSFNGTIDEIRIRNGASMADWIAADWAAGIQSLALVQYDDVTLNPLRLSLAWTGSNAVVHWAASGVGFVLYSATNLALPVSWLRVTNLTTLVAEGWEMFLPPLTNGARILRLQSN
jgi:hypothetical protein